MYYGECDDAINKFWILCGWVMLYKSTATTAYPADILPLYLARNAHWTNKTGKTKKIWKNKTKQEITWIIHQYFDKQLCFTRKQTNTKKKNKTILSSNILVIQIKLWSSLNSKVLFIVSLFAVDKSNHNHCLFVNVIKADDKEERNINWTLNHYRAQGTNATTNCFERMYLI